MIASSELNYIFLKIRFAIVLLNGLMLCSDNLVFVHWHLKEVISLFQEGNN